MIGGYGSVPGSVFERLGELRPRDRIVLLQLEQGAQSVGFGIRLYRTATEIYAVSERPRQQPIEADASEAAGLTLVTDMAARPLDRLIVHAVPSDR